MKKIKLSENDIVRIVKRVVNEKKESLKKDVTKKNKSITMSEEELIDLIEQSVIKEMRDAAPMGFAAIQSLGISKPTDKYKREMGEGYLEDLAQKDLTGQTQLPPEDEDDMTPDGMDDDSDNNRKMMGEEDEWMQDVDKEIEKDGTEGTFTEWCKSKGLLDDEGKVTCDCVKAGKESDDEKTVKRATLAGTFLKAGTGSEC